ncbi:MAG: HD domain-containing protein [Fimbriimonadia bacterium]|jgi:poly(A) polymerase
MSTALDEAIAKLRDATSGTEYENSLFLVGGYVRDKRLGIPPADDLDLVLEGNACTLASFLFHRSVSSHAPVLYPRFGTARVQVAGVPVEIVGARRETYDPFSRKPHVVQTDLATDALRRDFTVNTLLENLHTGEMFDPLGRGMEDLSQRILRTPLEPQRTFRDDPLRMLRAVRLACKLGFAIAEDCEEAIRVEADRLRIVSGERIRDELTKMLLHASAGTALRRLERLGLLAAFAPELQAMVGCEQNGVHICDVWEHTVLAVEGLPPDASLPLRLATVLHDVGKPLTKSVDEDGRIRFYDHQVAGLAPAKAFLRRLKFPNHVTADTLNLVRLHMRPGGYSPQWTDGAVRRLLRDAGPLFDDLLILCRADAAARRVDLAPPDLDGLEERARKVATDFHADDAKSPLSGREIMDALGIQPGDEVGRLKNELTEAVLDGRLAKGDKEGALRMLRAMREG